MITISNARVTAEDLSYALLAALRLWQHHRYLHSSPTPITVNDMIIRNAAFGTVIDGRRWTIRIADEEYIVSVRNRRKYRH